MRVEGPQTGIMKSEIVDVNETRRDLTIEVPSEVVNEAIGNAAAKLGRTVKIPGFRPGKVPATVIRQRFKPQILQDVAEHRASEGWCERWESNPQGLSATGS